MSENSTGGFRSRSRRGEKPKKPALTQQERRHKAEGKQPTDRPKARSRKSFDNAQATLSGSGVDDARIVAYETLRKTTADDAFANLVLPRALKDRGITGRDAAFATELTYGTLRSIGVLDAVIAESSTRPLDDLAPEVLDALRLGAYQVLYLRVEDHAAVDTTVRLVEGSGHGRSKGFANAVMRTITRTSFGDWMNKLAPTSEIAATAFRHAHPTWIAESFSHVLPSGELEAALESDSQRPIVHLVAKPGEITAEELALSTGGDQGQYSPYAVYLESGDPGDLAPIKDGLAGVQDEGSQLIARALTEVDVDEDHGRWLDLCAGPGGKAALIGAIARIDGAHLDAVESAPHRAKLVDKATRGLPVTVHVADGRHPDLPTGFDRVLVDAPCSGLGALRRRPEARWRKQESDIAELSQLQFELLSEAVHLTRDGGVVIYATCSPDQRETRTVVDRAIKELGVKEEDAHHLVPMSDVGDDPSVQMWPHRHGTDAMFFAVLRV